ncbi:hypothetical protein [Aureimonas sp. SK2]|uniref:hypothetical protein n=1 Tax=Aureimonas sp. SK2 TaxID=3015992 RepID=UPI002443A6C9|nr:hypothetical protein [Aureimonas sp. SK2]
MSLSPFSQTTADGGDEDEAVAAFRTELSRRGKPVAHLEWYVDRGMNISDYIGEFSPQPTLWRTGWMVGTRPIYRFKTQGFSSWLFEPFAQTRAVIGISAVTRTNAPLSTREIAEAILGVRYEHADQVKQDAIDLVEAEVERLGQRNSLFGIEELEMAFYCEYRFYPELGPGIYGLPTFTPKGAAYAAVRGFRAQPFEIECREGEWRWTE